MYQSLLHYFDEVIVFDWLTILHISWQIGSYSVLAVHAWTYMLLYAMLGKCMFQLHLLKHLNLGAVWFILGNSNVNVNESCCYRLLFN
jgi:hypothetical protein